MSKLEEILKIAEIHRSRIEMSVNDLENIFPLDEKQINNLNKEQLLLLELLTSRFAKLQDLIGKKIIDEFLLSKGELIDKDTMIDKINKLERMEIIEDAQIWQRMRDVRNRISHEYPDHPELTAMYLNRLFDLTPQLLAILNRIKESLNV